MTLKKVITAFKNSKSVTAPYKKMISDWQKLLEQIEVQKDSLTLATEAEILEFEKRNGIILPAGYKEYCQVFGQGQIGNAVIDIHIPFCYGEFQLERFTKDEKETLLINKKPLRPATEQQGIREDLIHIQG